MISSTLLSLFFVFFLKLRKGDDGKNKLVDFEFSRCNIERALDLLFGRGVVLYMMILDRVFKA